MERAGAVPPTCDALLVNRNASRWLRRLARFGVLQEDRTGGLRVNWDTLRPQTA